MKKDDVLNILSAMKKSYMALGIPDPEAVEALELAINAVKAEPYKEGLNNAWECARKIGNNSQTGLEMIGFDFSEMKDGICLHYNPSWWVIEHYTASEAIQKIKEYEEKQKIEGTEEEG